MGSPGNRTIVVVGRKAAGKTSVVHRLIDKPIDFAVYTPTIDECYNITWKMTGGQFLQIQIIDTAPWNEFPAMQSLFVKMAHLVLVVYDVTSPNWRQSLESLIHGVREIKADADIIIVCNKCDKLTKEDGFTPKHLSDITKHRCIGQTYTSALSQQGIVGLKQLILCSKSKLTDGHFREFSQVPKRKKLKKKANGMAISLQLWKKKVKPFATPIASPSVTSRASPSVPLSDVNEKESVDYTDYINGNFDKLFKSAQREMVLDLNKNKQSPKVANLKLGLCSPGGDSWSSNDLCSSTDASPVVMRQLPWLPCVYPYKGRRKSLDFLKLEIEDRSLVRNKLCRKISMSCGDDINNLSPSTCSSYESDYSSSELIHTPPTGNGIREKYPADVLPSPEGYMERSSCGYNRLKSKESRGGSFEGFDSEIDIDSSRLHRYPDGQRYAHSQDMLHCYKDETPVGSSVSPPRPLRKLIISPDTVAHTKQSGPNYIKQLAKQHSSAEDLSGGRRRLVRQ